MPKQAKSSSKEVNKKQKGRSKRKTAAVSTNISQESRDIIDNSQKEGAALSKGTLDSYQCAFKNARKWIQEYDTATALQNAATIDLPEGVQYEFHPGHHIRYNPKVHSPYSVIYDPDFETSLDGPPKRTTPAAMALYLSYRIVDENLGMSTLNTIDAAFKNHYKNMENGRYRKGDWEPRNEGSTEEYYVGSPGTAFEYTALVSHLKREIVERGDTRHHSHPMTIEAMRKLMAYSLEKCPQSLVDDLAEGCVKDEDFNEVRLLVVKHLWFRGWLTAGWTLWTRCSELAEMRWGDIIFDYTPPKRPTSRSKHRKCACVNVPQRKGWTSKLRKGVSIDEQRIRGHSYHIFSDPPEGIEVDSYFHLMAWRDFYQKFYLQTSVLDPSLHVFPSFHTSSGEINRRKRCGNAFTMLLKEFAVAAGLVGANEIFTFTSHCLRRGGAQYRFMYAPIGHRWPLQVIRWWGGWSENEQKDTLMRYLLDELDNVEGDYASALDPDRLKEDQSFLGEHLEMRPVTASQLDEVAQNLEARLLRQVKVAVAQELEAKMGDFHSLEQRLVKGITSNILNAVTDSLGSSQLHQNNLPASSISVTNAIHSNPPVPDVNATPSTPVVISDPSPQHRNNITTMPSTTDPSNITQDCQTTAVMSLPGLVIKEGKPKWRCAVLDWENADPERGLDQPLKNWTKDRYTGKINGRHQAKYGQRRLLAEEYLIRCNGDDAKFYSLYPNADTQGVSTLIEEIRRNNPVLCKKRSSKNGTPDERATQRRRIN
ncbi:hypothetical protein FRC02_002199 [Tulasnella sp. 418]|nr:hypothetical protein FRC02_002199 [Tulasnella sp. 418]